MISASAPTTLVVALVAAAVAATQAAAVSPTLIQPEWGYYFQQNDQGDGSYSFGYDVEDSVSGNVQFRRESRGALGAVVGSYGLVEPDGNVRVVRYTADPSTGYRVTIENSQRPHERHPPSDAPSPGSDAFRHAVAAANSWPRRQQLADRRTPPAALTPPLINT